MRRTAPLRLKKLLSDHQHTDDSSGAKIDDSYNGVSMFLELKGLKDEDLKDYLEMKYVKLADQFRDVCLPDNCPPDLFSSRVNGFLVNVNPFLERSYSGASLSKIILGQLPQSIAGEVRNLRRALQRDGVFSDPAAVQAEALKLLAEVYDPSKASSRAIVSRAIALGTSIDAISKCANWRMSSTCASNTSIPRRTRPTSSPSL
jgi:hypothetical protein